MALNVKQRKHLKSLGHHLKPLVLLGNAGITTPVIREIALALARHELVKIRLPGVARTERTQMVKQICAAIGASTVQEIGRVAIIYRPAEKPRIVLPA
ncbi:MAG: YhbY family RNA-binding protein [Sulfuricaulis sp.]